MAPNEPEAGRVDALSPTAPDTAPAPVKIPRRRWLWAGLSALLLLIVLPLAGVYGLLHHAAALPWALRQVPGLTVLGQQGTLADGHWQAQSLVWQLPAQAGQLTIEGLVIDGGRLRWSRGPQARLSVEINQLSAKRVQYLSGPPATTPRTAPADLRLPLSLTIAALRVDRLQIDALPTIDNLTASVALGDESGRQHRLRDVSLTWQQAHLQGDLQIGSAAPMPLRASLRAQRQAAPAWGATLELRGPLARLEAAVHLQGELAEAGDTTKAPQSARPSLNAQATLLPFAPWPLAALTLDSQALDLASLAPGLPHTTLSGTAKVASTGLDQAATVDAALSNGQPGAWDAGLLPLQKLVLQASGEPRHTDRLTLQHFELLLADSRGPAGQITGQGQWAADTLALDLQIKALMPDRLHGQAAALLLSGPVSLRATGLPVAGAASTVATAVATASPSASTSARPSPAPNSANATTSATASPTPQLAVDATLSGSAANRRGLPVQLRLVADGSAHHLHISQAEASAGAARASVKLDAKSQPAGWQLRGQAVLAQFDPRPWWRGVDGSAWQRGPHRLDGTLDIDLLWRGLGTDPATGNATATGPVRPSPTLDGWLNALSGDATFKLDNSVLAGVPVSAALKLHSAGQNAKTGAEIDASANLAGNLLSLQGKTGAAPTSGANADHWRLQVQGAKLAALAPLGHLVADLAPGTQNLWPSAGSLHGDLQINGRWPLLQTQGELRAVGLATGAGALQSATLSWLTGNNADAPLALDLQALGLSSGVQRLDSLSAKISGTLRNHSLQLRADSPVKPPTWAENLLGPAGTGSQLQADGQGSWTPSSISATNATTNARADLGADAHTASGGIWRLQNLQLQGGARQPQGDSRPWAAAQALSAEWVLGANLAPKAFTLAPGRVQLLSTAVNWREARWTSAAQSTSGSPAGASEFRLVAELERFDVAALLARLQPNTGWGGQLALGGHIDIRSAEKMDADVVLERVGGDLTLTDDLGATQALGVTDLRLALSAHDGVWQFAQGLAGRSLGEMAGAQVLRTTADKHWPPADATLQGVIESRVANLGIWGAWVPPGWRLSGNLRTSASFAGTMGAPEIRGEMVGSGLGARNLLQGLSFADGDLALTLSGDTARIERFVFKGGDGQLSLTGGATLGAAPSASVHLIATQFRLLGRIDRRLVASGSADLHLDAQHLRLDGGFTVDEGLIDLSRGDAPRLDSDVVVHRGGLAASGAGAGPGAGTAATIATTKATTGASAQAAPSTANPVATATVPATPVPVPLATPLRQAQVALKFKLGDKLRLRGNGVDTGVRGELQLSTPEGKLALHGQVRTDGGTFAAYGQKLEISRGELTFTGPADNPRLDIQAIRPNLDVRVGVVVVGTALNPRIRLFSEPDLPEYDKLSWLVLGRSPDGLGRTDTALLQRAAFALLAGDGQSPSDALLGAIGLTDFSVRQSDGDTRETIVSLGKQLSRRWYLGYERSVNATTGTWQLIYRIAQRFTLRAQSGTENALDVIWSWRW